MTKGMALAFETMGKSNPALRMPYCRRGLVASQLRFSSSHWKPHSASQSARALDEWVERPIRPISLRQLFFFGRRLTESRLISSANYVRTELPTRLAHRLRDMQKLPYVVVTNPRLALVYDLYWKAFEVFRQVPTIRTVEDNDRYCKMIKTTLNEHLAVIPNLIIGVLECQDLVQPETMESFIDTMLRARISRRVIAEQHLALTETFDSLWHFAESKSESDFVGEVLLRCNARDIVQQSGQLAQRLSRKFTDSDSDVPEINISGSLDATFPYIQSHLDYIVGELLRNSILAVMEKNRGSNVKPPPIEVLICEAPQHLVIRFSDQGGGILGDTLPYLWTFNKGTKNAARLHDLHKVPKLAATVSDLQGLSPYQTVTSEPAGTANSGDLSLGSLNSRPPELRLGMGLPMSRIYAEYWAGSLRLHSLEGHGVDAFLQISKLGNQNEQIHTRASVDAV